MFDINAIVSAALLAAVEQATKPLLERIDAMENHPALAGVHHERIKSLVEHTAALELRIMTLEDHPAQGTDAALLERINALENALRGQGWVDTMLERIVALENNPAQGTDAALAARVGVVAQFLVSDKTRLDDHNDRITALEDAKGMSAAAFVTYLDGEEWFWEKLSRKAGEIAQGVAEETLHDHTCEYDHAGYDDMAQKLDDLREAIDDRLDDCIDDKLEEKVSEKMDEHCQTYDHDVYDGLSATLEEMGDIDDLVKREELRAEIEDVIGNARISIKL